MFTAGRWNPQPRSSVETLPTSRFARSLRVHEISATVCSLAGGVGPTDDFSIQPLALRSNVEVGTPVARCPPHRSRRAVFPHRALQPDTSSIAHRKVCQSCSVNRTGLVACVDFVRLSAPSVTSGRQPCGDLLRADPTPRTAFANTPCRRIGIPAWLAQFVRRDSSRPPSFDVFPSARATLLDPGKPSATSPQAVALVLGSSFSTSSPLASIPFEAELLKQDAGPVCGSRFSLDTLLDVCSTR